METHSQYKISFCGHVMSFHSSQLLQVLQVRTRISAVRQTQIVWIENWEKLVQEEVGEVDCAYKWRHFLEQNFDTCIQFSQLTSKGNNKWMFCGLDKDGCVSDFLPFISHIYSCVYGRLFRWVACGQTSTKAAPFVCGFFSSPYPKYITINLSVQWSDFQLVGSNSGTSSHPRRV